MVLNSHSWKGICDGPTAASGLTARGSEAAAPGAPVSSACKPTPLKVSRAEMMQDQEQHTLFTHMCMHPPPHARTSAFTHPCTRTHTCTLTCVHLCTHKNKRTCEKVYARTLTLYAHAHIHACMYEPQHAHKYVRTCMHPRIHTTISKHAQTHIRARKQAYAHAHM